MKNPVKQRNHVALALQQRGSGSRVHGKSKKATRRADKISLKKGVEY